jgi:hypothetical protein
MNDRTRSRNLAVRRRASCFHVPFLLPALFFGWLLLGMPVAVQAQFNYTVTNGTVTITGYTGTNADVVIPSTIDGLPVTAIGDSAFIYCTSLTSVSIPSSVTSIGDHAFGNCISLTSVTIPNSVTNIEDS